MRVAFLGLGIMGSRMAANVAAGGFELTVWNRTAANAERFCAEHEGVKLAATPAAAAASADIVITMVVDGTQVEDVLLGENGAATAAPEGVLCVDCSTIGPDATLAIGEALSERGIELMDAPVTGSSPRAEDGTLTIMAGGTEEAFARARPVLEAMGKLIVHAGPLGHGQIVKLINNAVAATNAAVVGEALLVASRSGVDLDALTTVMSAGSGGSAMLELKAGPMREHDYTTLFKLSHMLKDVRLCLEQGQAAGAPFQFAALTREILTAGMGRGLGALAQGQGGDLRPLAGHVAGGDDARQREPGDEADAHRAQGREIGAEAPGQEHLGDLLGRRSELAQEDLPPGGDRGLGELELAHVALGQVDRGLGILSTPVEDEDAPLEIDEGSLAFDAHLEVGAGGHFLGAAHTLERFRECFYRPLLSSTENFDRWTKKGARDTTTRASEVWRATLETYKQPPLDEGVREELEESVVRRRAELRD
ncbi:MAG TPA: trimethylamine methyltransferase family protein [Solirubrobacteraceae bacterium]|nr:trimethylamine methyltransferase family protein [Solirubrobacteraceae bacterium]